MNQPADAAAAPSAGQSQPAPSSDQPSQNPSPQVSSDGLLCALVLAPHTFPRNRFYGLFEHAALRRARHRARLVRGIFKQLSAPGSARAVIVGRLELADGSVLLRYRVEGLAFERTTALSALESAVLAYALHQSLGEELNDDDRQRVERALEELGTPVTQGPRPGMGAGPGQK